MRPKSQMTLAIPCRWAWALLYNHPGNLWVGNADDNQIIGFMYATVYGTLSRMKKMLGDSAPKNGVHSRGAGIWRSADGRQWR